MSSFLFLLSILVLGYATYYYLNQKWKKRESAINDFAFEIQRELRQSNTEISQGVDYFKQVQNHFEDLGYTLTKHPDFSTDFIAKKDKEICFIRIQGPQERSDITAKVYQNFVGQTVLYALDNPLYASYALKWRYVCSKMMCDRSAKIYMKKYEERLAFDLIEIQA